MAPLGGDCMAVASVVEAGAGAGAGAGPSACSAGLTGAPMLCEYWAAHSLIVGGGALGCKGSIDGAAFEASAWSVVVA